MSDDRTASDAGPEDADLGEDAAFDAFDTLSAENAALKKEWEKMMVRRLLEDVLYLKRI